MAMLIPSQMGYPAPEMALSVTGAEMRAMITPERPMMEPMDRSIPPVMMTKLTPMEKIPNMAICRVVLRTLASR